MSQALGKAVVAEHIRNRLGLLLLQIDFLLRTGDHLVGVHRGLADTVSSVDRASTAEFHQGS